MNSVHLRVVDAVGTSYLDTFTANTPEAIAAFRKHAAWWLRWSASPAAWETYRKSPKGGPIAPTRVVVTPYHDASAC